MNNKLYPNIRRLTTGFCIAILAVTLSVLTLRLTVFSDMAAPPEAAADDLFSSDGYEINTKIHFPTADGKGDLYITNLSAENMIKVNLTLNETGESIYYTGFIKPGASIKLDRMNAVGQQLEEGRYDCMVEVSAYGPDDYKTAIGAAKTEVELYIGEKPAKEK